MAYPVSRQKLIAKIHIAKNQLGLDNDVYRLILKDVAGKESCSKMNFADLNMVLHAMKQRGFKVKAPAKEGKRLSRPSGGTSYSRRGQDKIVAIWITMHKQGFIEDGSATAIDKFVQSQTDKIGMFAISSLHFLTPQMASKLIEILKKWHIRVITKELKRRGLISLLSNNGLMPYAELVNAFDTVTQECEIDIEVTDQ